MAITATSYGSTQNKTAATTVAFNTTSTIPMGTLLVIGICADNVTATTPTVTGITAVGGGTWTNQAGSVSQSGATATAGAGVFVYCQTLFTTTSVTSGTTITVTFDSSPVAKAVELWGFSEASPNLRSTVVSGASTAGTPSATTAGTALVAGDLVIGIAGAENNVLMTGDADTLNGNWSTIDGIPSTGASAATNVVINMQWKVVNATGAQTFNPTGGVLDSVAIVFAMQPMIVWTASGSDPVGVTYLFATEITAERTDAVGVTDTWQTVISTDDQDSVPVTDTIQFGKTYNPVTNPVGITDSLYHSKILDKSDTVGITESPQTISAGYSYPSPTNITDTVAKTVGSNPADPENLTDSETASTGSQRSDQIGITDTVFTYRVLGGGATDPENITDSYTKDVGRALSDAENLRDSVGYVGNWVRGYADSENLTDSAGKTETAARADSVGITDSFTVSRGFGKNISDPVGVTDTRATARGIAISLSDLQRITDSVARTMTYVRDYTDRPGPTDRITLAAFFNRTFTNPVDINDWAVKEKVGQGRPKIWKDAAFQSKAGKIWTGTVWVEKKWKRWDGSKWTLAR